ncbi:DUF2489 domain-containing protein [Litoribacillus peritrichatus]|uniref:DUF2489 domain-containing protein n=1 Tax=Litoribacillus peritrichatus TaxID=718191 RepID=A0ABP7MFS6_9GAMM
MTTLHFVLLFTGVLIIAGLGYWAWSLTQKVKEKEQDILKAINEKYGNITESIRVITSAYGDNQIELVEASIRLKVLLDNLPLSDAEKEPYAVFSVVYDKVAHIPTHENWKALKKNEKKQYEKEMKTIEKDYQDLFASSVETLKAHKFDFTPKVQYTKK